MFNNDCELWPRTYAIKGYRRRHALNFRKVLAYTLYSAVLFIILGIALLSIYNIV